MIVRVLEEEAQVFPADCVDQQNKVGKDKDTKTRFNYLPLQSSTEIVLALKPLITGNEYI